jgi:hypothetical protein
MGRGDCVILRGMSEIRELLERPLVMMAVGAIILLFALNAFSGGGFGIIIGLLLALVGGNSLWRGFTKWQAGRS